jgi:hypothetical protein
MMKAKNPAMQNRMIFKTVVWATIAKAMKSTKGMVKATFTI